jgi:periplasmic divalent cation tolerance protein
MGIGGVPVKLVIATAPEEKAREIADALLGDRLVACVNVLPAVKSRYWWRGELEEAVEAMLFMKTTDELAPAAVARLVEVHPYEVPEAIVVDVEGGHRPYFDWVDEVTR